MPDLPESPVPGDSTGKEPLSKPPIRPSPPGKAAAPARPAPPVRAAPKVEIAADALDEKGTALAALLPRLLAGEDLQMGVEVDEVSVRVPADRLQRLCRRMKAEPALAFDYLRCLSVVDYIDRLEVNYHLFSYSNRHKLVVKTDLSPDAPSVPTVIGVWRAADWFEREGHDLFGVVFAGHPNLSPLLLYEGFDGYPGRKSFPFHDYDEW